MTPVLEGIVLDELAEGYAYAPARDLLARIVDPTTPPELAKRYERMLEWLAFDGTPEACAASIRGHAVRPADGRGHLRPHARGPAGWRCGGRAPRPGGRMTGTVVPFNPDVEACPVCGSTTCEDASHVPPAEVSESEHLRLPDHAPSADPPGVSCS